MSSEPVAEKQLITIDEEEFNQVLKRVHSLLVRRAERAQAQKVAKPSRKSEERHIETVKDVFALVHMMEIIEHMTEEITDLKETIEATPVRKNVVSSFDMFSCDKKDYFN